MFLYKWNDGDMLSVEDFDQCDVQKDGEDDDHGIDQFIENLDQIEGYLKTCLNYLKTKLPKGVRSGTVPIFLGATGGMRMVMRTNETIATRLMNEVDKVLGTSGFYFEKGNSKIISGEEEGALAWLTVRKLTNSEKVGILDLGGSSAQISFKYDDDNFYVDPRNEDTYQLLVNERHMSIISHTSSCTGIEEMMRKFVVLLAFEKYHQNHNLDATIDNPCMVDVAYNSTDDYWLPNFQLDVEEFKGKCTKMSDPRFEEEFFKWLKGGGSFKATGSEEDCSGLISRLFDERYCYKVFEEECFQFPYVHRPKTTTSLTYFAISEYYWDFFRLFDPKIATDDKIPMTDIIRQKRMICLEGGSHETHCFKLNFFFTLLSNGYGKFQDDDDFDGLRYTRQINGSEVGWTLGYMMNEVLYYKEPSKGSSKSAQTFFILLSSLAVVHFAKTLLS